MNENQPHYIPSRETIDAKDEAAANASVSSALAEVREPWEPETTARNLSLIREARAERNEKIEWADDIEDALRRRSTRA